jgi:hypothetical protein
VRKLAKPEAKTLVSSTAVALVMLGKRCITPVGAAPGALG